VYEPTWESLKSAPVPAEEVRIMRGIGDWLKVNGEGIYATRPWKKVAEGVEVDDLRTEAFSERRGQIAASWRFQKLEASQGDAVRLTRSKDYSSLFAFVIGQPESGSVTIKTLHKGNVDKQGQGIKSVSLLGSDAKIDWKQGTEGLTIEFPDDLPFEVAYGFRITTNSGKVDDSTREHLDDPIERKGDWPVFRSTR